MAPSLSADGRDRPSAGVFRGASSDGPSGGRIEPVPVQATGWSRVEVHGRPAAWFWPDLPVGERFPRVLLHLHDLVPPPRMPQDDPCEGTGQRIGAGLEFIGPRDRRLVESAGLPTLVPEGGSCWWLDKPVPSFHATLSPAAFLVGPCQAEIQRCFPHHPSVAISGIGMGGQAALGLAYRHPDRFPLVAAIDPILDFHLVMRDDDEGSGTLHEVFAEVEHARQQTAILHVHPLNWPRRQVISVDPGRSAIREGVERLRGKLAALGIPHELLVDGSAGAIEAVATRLRDGMDRESGRLSVTS